MIDTTLTDPFIFTWSHPLEFLVNHLISEIITVRHESAAIVVVDASEDRYVLKNKRQQWLKGKT